MHAARENVVSILVSSILCSFVSTGEALDIITSSFEYPMSHSAHALVYKVWPLQHAAVVPSYADLQIVKSNTLTYRFEHEQQTTHMGCGQQSKFI